MDRLVYTAMSGAKHAFHQQAAVAHNLANATSTGYRAQEHKFRAVPVFGESGVATRAAVVDAAVVDDFRQGPLQHTGRVLDVAVDGRGWLAVQMPDGSEAYTRNGSFEVNANGQLQTRNGLNVMGDGGPIAMPPDSEITVAKDGTISLVPRFGTPNNVQAVGRLKLVNPAEGDLVRGDDGFFRLRDGNPAPADANVKVSSGYLEGSNVNVVDAMVNMISLARQFEMQIKMVQNADANARASSQLLSVSR